MLGRFVIETAYGVYPPGTWGFRSTRSSLDRALADCGSDERVKDTETGEVFFPGDSTDSRRED